MPTQTISCNTDDLLAASKCFKCIPIGEQNAIIIYLLNTILGTGLTVDQLIDGAKCIQKCVPDGMQPAIQTYLLCQLVNSA